MLPRPEFHSKTVHCTTRPRRPITDRFRPSMSKTPQLLMTTISSSEFGPKSLVRTACPNTVDSVGDRNVRVLPWSSCSARWGQFVWGGVQPRATQYLRASSRACWAPSRSQNASPSGLCCARLGGASSIAMALRILRTRSMPMVSAVDE